jgi:hypothetical protein
MPTPSVSRRTSSVRSPHDNIGSSTFVVRYSKFDICQSFRPPLALAQRSEDRPSVFRHLNNPFKSYESEPSQGLLSQNFSLLKRASIFARRPPCKKLGGRRQKCGGIQFRPAAYTPIRAHPEPSRGAAHQTSYSRKLLFSVTWCFKAHISRDQDTSAHPADPKSLSRLLQSFNPSVIQTTD